MTRPTVPALSFFTVIGAILLAPVLWRYYWPAGGEFDIVGYHLGRDFINMWSGPQIAAKHGVLMLFDFHGYHWAQADLAGRYVHFHNWGYPLYLLFLALPFSLLPYIPSLILWTLIGFAAYSAALLPQITPEKRLAALLLLLAAPSTLVNAIGGQNGFFTAALFIGGIALMERRPWFAGVLFGLLTIKPHLGVLIAVALAVTLAWRTILAASMTAALLVLSSWLVFGTEPWVRWLTETSQFQYHLLMFFSGFYTYMMTSVFASARFIGVPPEIANTIQLVISMCVLATTAFVVRKTADAALRTLLLASGTLLVSPYGFNYDMTALTAAMLWVMLARGPMSTAATFVFGAAWIVPSAAWILNGSNLGASPLAYGGVYVFAVMTILRESAKSTAPITGAVPQAA